MLFFFDTGLVGVTTGGSIATTESDYSGCSGGGCAVGGWDDVSVVAAEVGTTGSDGS